MSSYEEVLVQALRDFMREDADRVAPDVRFDALGLDSLALLRFARKAQQETGIEFDAEWLFDYPTIAELGRFLDSRRSTGDKPAAAS